MCSAVKYSQGQLLRESEANWMRHKKEKKRKSWRWNGVPDELSRSGVYVLEETQHVSNAALILRHAIQSLQPITPFPAEPADLSEEKIDLHVPSELYNFLSWIMTGNLSSGYSTLSEQESRARQLFFAHIFSRCAVQFPFLYLHHWIQIILMMLFKLQSCVKLIHIKNETWIFCSFQSANQKVIHQYHVFFSFYVPSHMHLQTRCASSNDFSVLIVLIQCLFWFIHIGFFITLFTKSVGFVSFFSPMQHSHIHTVFKHYHEQDGMIEKQKFVQCHH